MFIGLILTVVLLFHSFTNLTVYAKYLKGFYILILYLHFKFYKGCKNILSIE